MYRQAVYYWRTIIEAAHRELYKRNVYFNNVRSPTAVASGQAVQKRHSTSSLSILVFIVIQCINYSRVYLNLFS